MPRRAKACAICRQKRIKCDATMPQCLMCIRFKRQCPGPTDAPLMFIDTSSYPSGKKPRKQKPVVESTPAAFARSQAVANWDTVSEYDDASDEEGRGLPEELAHVMLVQVSPRYILNEAFFANLVCFFCAEGRHIPGSVRRTPSWLHALPRMASNSSARNDDSNGLGLAIRATTAAFSGIESRNMGLLEYASGLYGGALRSQGRVLQAKGMKAVGIEMAATSVMLSMFEAVVATTGQAYAAHIIGAAKMIEVALEHAPKPSSDSILGPPGLGHGKGRGRPMGARSGGPPGGGPPGAGGGPGPLLTNMFFHIRIQLAYVHLTTTDVRMRNDPVMQTVLMDACGWPPSKLPLNMQILVPLARLANLTFEDTTPTAYGLESLQEYQTAKHEISTLWQEYEATSKGQRLCWTNHETGHTDFRDPFTSLNYAYFSACRILLDLLASSHTTNTAASQRKPSVASTVSVPSSSADSSTSSLTIRTSSPSDSSSGSPASSTTTASTTSPSSSTTSLDPINTDHYALILSVAWYLRLRDVGFSYLRLHIPLFLVAMYAPLEEQRRVARMIFEEWKGGALKGIGTLGLERVYEADRLGRGVPDEEQTPR